MTTNNQEGEFTNTTAVAINLPEFGPVGFTSGCITSTNYNGVRTRALELPINK